MIIKLDFVRLATFVPQLSPLIVQFALFDFKFQIKIKSKTFIIKTQTFRARAIRSSDLESCVHLTQSAFRKINLTKQPFQCERLRVSGVWAEMLGRAV